MRCRFLAHASVSAVAVMAISALGQDVTRPTYGVVEGLVVQADSRQPISFALVELRGAGEKRLEHADEKGNYRFLRVPFAKDLSVRAEAPGFFPSSSFAVPISSVQPEVTQLLPMHACGVISGIVNEPGDEVIDAVDQATPIRRRVQLHRKLRKNESEDWRLTQHPGHQILVQPDEFLGIEETWTDERGRYRFDRLAAGTYYVGVQPQEVCFRYPCSLESSGRFRETFYRNAAALRDATPIQLSAGQQVVDIEMLKSEGGVTISGHLAFRDDANTARFVSGEVRLLGVDGYVAGRSWLQGPQILQGLAVSLTAWTGAFELQNVLPGRYILEVTAEAVSGDFIFPAAAGWQIIEVADIDLRGIEVPVRGRTSLAGSVRLAKGCPVVPVMVQYGTVGSAGSRRALAISDRNGAIDMAGLLPGRYVMSFSVEGAKRSYQINEARVGDQNVLHDVLEITADPGPLEVVVSCTGAGW